MQHDEHDESRRSAGPGDAGTTRVRPSPDDDATVVVRPPHASSDSETLIAGVVLEGIVDETAVAPGAETALRPHDLRTGSVINGRFVIEGVLGRGGMGVVYRARDLRKEETGDRDPFVALKVLSDEFRRDPRMVVALQRESRKAQTLAHPNIATVYDFDRDGDIVYMTMEELDGQPLNDVIREHPLGLPKAEALSIIRGLSLGLAYAHNKNIIHSDFKPGNAFLTGSRQVRILDFGIARAAPLERFDASEQTRFDAGEIGALTPSYAACEMFEGKEPHPADDVYALAIVAYQLLSGRHPFDNVPSPQARQQGLEPRPIKGLKRREWRALRRGLAFEREERSKHAAEFLADLEGPSRVKMLASAAALLGLLFVAYVVVVQIRERERALPDIPFEQLAVEDQARITRALEEGAMFVRFGDEGSALMLYREAYEIHPRNPEVVIALEGLFVDLAARAAARGDSAELRRVQENLARVMAIDDFLGNRPALVRAESALAAALR
jgi:hypothetical protein